MPRRKANEKWAELARLVDGGMPLRRATEIVGVSYARGSMECKARGVMVRLPRGSARAEVVDSIARRWTDEEMADEYEVTLATARRWRAQVERGGLRLHPVDRRQVLELVAEGKTNAEVAQQMRCSVTTVWRIRRAA